MAIQILLSDNERSLLVAALEVYRDELERASDAVGSRLMTEKFNLDATKVLMLIQSIKSAAPVPQAETDIQIRELLNQGKKIDAIKLMRERTNMSLKEAKDYVDKF